MLDDHAGFDAIFDGDSLKGWDGDPAFWRAENGAIVGESTPERAVTQNTFIIWRGGEPGDFELKCEYPAERDQQRHSDPKRSAAGGSGE